MTVPGTVDLTISAKELAERKWIVKCLHAAASWLRSKCVGWNVHCEVVEEGDVYRAIMTVEWKPLPPPRRVIPSTQEGLLEPVM
jgi:hypothetical protein